VSQTSRKSDDAALLKGNLAATGFRHGCTSFANLT